MKFIHFLVIILSISWVHSATKFVLVGSLGDLAKKYLWSALEENVWNSDKELEIYGASRNPVPEGQLKLAEILDKLPKRYSPLDGLEEKLNAAFSKLPDGNKILSESKETANVILQKLNVFGENLKEKTNGLFNKLTQPHSEMKNDFSLLFNAISDVGEKVFDGGQDALGKFLPEFNKVVDDFAKKSPKSSEELMSAIKILLKHSQGRLSESKDAAIGFLNGILMAGTPFQDRVTYLQLKTDAHFADFCGDVKNGLVIFYLSIPPSAYITTSEMISKHCRKDGVTLRVAYEKPFGYGLDSAEQLFSSLDRLIGNDNIYLIDHYLGKSITQQIPLLRRSDKEIEALLNNDNVQSIHVRLLEEVDCEGRAGYYDKSGVFRDMLQNHATELLTLITADVNRPDFAAAKSEVLKSLTKPNKHQVVVAQYHSYREHVGGKSLTPTFASVLFLSDLSRWEGVPLILTSGKSQNSDKKDIEVNLKSGGRLHINFKPPEIKLNGRSLLPESFTAASNSYVTLLSNVLDGNKTLLPDINTVLASWNIWDHVINLKHSLLLHPNHKNMAVSNFGKFLIAGYTENPMEEEHIKFFNKAFMVSDHEEHLYEHVVHDIVRVIGETLEGSDKVHIAVSGGSTILGVYKYLVAYSSKKNLPWKKVHIWQVDERCEAAHANARDLKEFLLGDIPDISPSQVHFMPVSEAGCGDISAYQKEFLSANPKGKFNYIILGLGSDGHTASLFPSSKPISKTADFKHVEVDTGISPGRMTVTFDLINRSDWVSILVTGSDKRDIIKDIKQGKKFPVSEVVNAQLTWFIDEILL
ncbi:GDH/6PGL endoplasmic bifunctional protein-like [Bolinopsis microptera]|uniref:GDH/6PGL endoplasmic bifunctional protein-like n=1 Tax=Bolinopsis microptera TaxID=2820187 RepID=UPI00307A463A